MTEAYSTFTYDAENKQVLVKNSSNVTRGEYWYDGDGKRVKKKAYDSSGNLTEETIFVYDATGRSIAEYSAIDPNQIEGGSTPQVAYLTNDHLGSPRINTDASGAVTSRHDYHPFGEEITTSQRLAHPDYAGDTVRKQFTGYEEDQETGLEFAEARFLSTTLGRYFSPDPLMESAEPDVPQSWNRYLYVIDNPLLFIDPTGLIWVRSGSDTYWFTDEEWKEKSKEVDESGNPRYRVLKESEFEFDSVEGRVRLDPLGPTTENPNGWSIIGPNVGSGAGSLAATAIVVSQTDGPEPFVMDVVAAAILAYAGYLATMHETLQMPQTATILEASTKDIQKSNPDKVAAAKKALEDLKATLEKLKATPNKTPEIKKQIETIKKAINKAKDALKKSEPHSIKGKRN